MNSKKKGSGGEIELLHILQDHGIKAVRNDQRYVGGYDNPDIAASFRGIPLHVEVKRTERLRLAEAMDQAVSDAAGAFPVVVHRSNRRPWIVSFQLDDLWRWVHAERPRDEGRNL